MSTSNLQPPPSPWGVKLEAQAWNELSASRLRSEVQPGAPLVPRLRHHKAPMVRDSATGGVGRCFTCEPKLNNRDFYNHLWSMRFDLFT